MPEPGSSERLQALQNLTLEAVARGEPLQQVMDSLCRTVEEIAPGVTCSVLTADAERRLQPLASPSLPAWYSASLTGLPSGPNVGSCGTAIHFGEEVVVTDIATDPLWAPFKAGPLSLGLLACWSSPIKARDGRVVGSFAFYFRELRGPTAFERLIVKTCLHLSAIAIEHEEVSARNYRLAYFDTLTGLPNRVHFNEAFARMTASDAPQFGLMLIDIDCLKTVNDTMGHGVGDALIATVGTRLAALAGSGFACRIGGDEFAVLIPGCTKATQLRAVASRILAGMLAPFEHDGNSITPSVTIGAALSGEDGEDGVTLRQNADLALYHAKETRRGGYVRFKRGLRTSMTRRVQTIRRVDGALLDGRIVPFYQPIVKIRTGQVIGLEALARMRLDDGGVATAGEFHEALRDPKVAYRVTGQMLNAIAADMAAWRQTGIAVPHVGLNVTAADFQKGDLVQRVLRMLDRAQLGPEHIIVEITEQVFMGSRKDNVARTMGALRERGIRVALDDFGTGFASLTHLLEFPVDIIKIDRSFVGGIESGAKSSVIIEALIAIASRLDMTIVAEGVENMAQAASLQQMNCRYGQGYLYSRAIPASTVTELVRRFGGRPARAREPQIEAVASAA
jgi:diguanylate cyclase (GGDEF)-like protein